MKQMITVFTAGLLAAACITGGIYWFGKYEPPAEVLPQGIPPAAILPRAQKTAKADRPAFGYMRGKQVEELNLVEQVDELSVNVSEQNESVDSELCEDKPVGLVSTNTLLSLLPEWMLKEEECLYTEQTKVYGSWITRSRGRYTWDGEIGVEVEITDAGPDAGADLVAGLGFNLAMTNSQNATGFTYTLDSEDSLVNCEYDVASAEGNVQLWVKGRFLVEIQLQSLPAESFQVLLDQISVDALLAMADESIR